MTQPGHEKGDVNDWSRLDIQGGVIHYAICQQDGSRQPMTARNTADNRRFVSWVQIHDQ